MDLICPTDFSRLRQKSFFPTSNITLISIKHGVLYYLYSSETFYFSVFMLVYRLADQLLNECLFIFANLH